MKSFRKFGLVHKYMKQKFKCGLTRHGSLQWRLVRLSDQVLVASRRVRLELACSSLKRTLSRSNISIRSELRSQLAQANCVQKHLGTLTWGSLRARLSERSKVQKKNFEFQNPFSQTLQFWSSHTQNLSQIKFIGHVLPLSQIISKKNSFSLSQIISKKDQQLSFLKEN